jgi:hypothetical protein
VGNYVTNTRPDLGNYMTADTAAHSDVYVADMPLAAQETRVYDDYLSRLGGLAPDQIVYAAISLVGPRKRVDRIVGGLKLLT